MQSLAENQQREDVRWYPGMAIALHDERQCRQVEADEDVLGQLDISAFIREVIEEAVDVYMSSWVDEWTCVAVEFDVVAFAAYVLRDLLHIRDPIDFSVCEDLVFARFIRLISSRNR